MMLRIRCIQRPCKLGPGPPYQPENEYGSAYVNPVKCAMQQMNDLCNGEDKDQVKKEFGKTYRLIIRR